MRSSVCIIEVKFIVKFKFNIGIIIFIDQHTIK